MLTEILSNLAMFYYDANKIFYRKRWRATRDIGSYTPPPDPTRIIHVNPHDIDLQHRNHVRKGEKYKAYENIGSDIGCIFNDDWEYQSIHQHLNFRSTYNHFRHDVSWENTDYYKHYKQRWKENEKDSLTYKNDEELQERLNQIDTLFKRIKQDGYRTQRELLEQNPYNIRYFPRMLGDEITIDIGKNGEFVLVDSKHRLAIAHALELEEVPVIIVGRHQKWMKMWELMTERVDKPDLADDIRNHPDFVGHSDLFKNIE